MTYKTFFRYRSIWMFFAIFVVVLYHQEADSANSFIRFFLYYGYFGVDIFLFASGLGCYFSYKKNGYAQFIRRRAMRILPVYLPFILVWCAVKLMRNEISALSAVANLFSLQLLIDRNESFNWYINAMWILYFLTPVFCAVADRIKKKSTALLLTIVLILVTLPILTMNIGTDTHLLIARFPVFFLGICFSKLSTESEKLPWHTIAAFFACIPIGVFLLIYCSINCPLYLKEYGVYWYPFVFVAPAVCMLISLICSAIEKISAGKYLVKLFDRLGSYSFEIYLIHFSAIEITKKYIGMNYPGQIKPILLCTAIIAAGVLVINFAKNLVNRAITALEKSAAI